MLYIYIYYIAYSSYRKPNQTSFDIYQHISSSPGTIDICILDKHSFKVTVNSCTIKSYSLLVLIMCITNSKIEVYELHQNNYNV